MRAINLKSSVAASTSRAQRTTHPTGNWVIRNCAVALWQSLFAVSQSEHNIHAPLNPTDRQTHTRAHAHACTHTHTHTQSHTRTRTHAHTHTHTHTLQVQSMRQERLRHGVHLAMQRQTGAWALCALVLVITHTCSHARMHHCTHAHVPCNLGQHSPLTHTHTCTHTHTYMHTYTHAHAHHIPGWSSKSSVASHSPPWQQLTVSASTLSHLKPVPMSSLHTHPLIPHPPTGWSWKSSVVFPSLPQRSHSSTREYKSTCWTHPAIRCVKKDRPPPGPSHCPYCVCKPKHRMCERKRVRVRTHVCMKMTERGCRSTRWTHQAIRCVGMGVGV